MNRLVDIISRMLEPDEREAVRGDLEESGATGGQALGDVLGLIARRQAGLWQDWRLWLTLLSLVIPLGVLLSQAVRGLAENSAIYSWMYVNNWTVRYLDNAGFRMEFFEDVLSFILQYLTLMFLSWTVGFVLGSLSRRAVWINGAAFCAVLLGEVAAGPPRHYGVNAAAFAVGFYRVVLPLILGMVLILIPALWGIYKGAQLVTLSVLQTMFWAAALAGLTAWRHLPLHWGPRMLLLVALAWPVAYMIGATRWRRWHHA